MFRVKRDDQVVVLSGKNRGKKGKVLRVYPSDGRVLVEGVNLIKRHTRKSQNAPQGAILEKESPLPVGKVMPLCPRCKQGVRVGFKVMPDGSKARICRKCEESF
ncbi:MAG: 50S ribosomal protein L24 [Candidatus Omnitrophica bacterium]|nr:50S ribosomal protein L24 [Candidatus Omnitrophota bacterium]